MPKGRKNSSKGKEKAKDSGTSKKAGTSTSPAKKRGSATKVSGALTSGAQPTVSGVKSNVSANEPGDTEMIDAEARETEETESYQERFDQATSESRQEPQDTFASTSRASSMLGPIASATQSPSITDIRKWNTKQLIQHLQAEFPKLKKDALDILDQNDVEGIAFLTLTEEKLMADGMKRGPAAVIAGYVNELNEEHAGSKRKFEEDKFEILKEIRGIREEIRADRMTTLSISRISQGQFAALLQKFGLRRESVEFDVTPTTKPIQPFTWGDKKEDANAPEYLKWLNGNINLPENVEFYIASSKSNLLSTNIEGIYDIHGTMDTAIVDRTNVRTQNVPGAIRVGLEHKKKVEPSDIRQAIMELILASYYSKYSVVMVLTDLGEVWQFFWLEESRVVDCLFDLKKGITLLETIAQNPSPPVGLSTPNAPYLQRCNFATATLQAKESNYALPEETKVGGLERLLQRSKVDIMDMLPKDDVADMRDVFDVMTPKEIHDWQLKRVLNFVMQSPAVQSCVGNESWLSMYG